MGVIMYNSEEKRYYSPQFSEMASVSLRRFAWYLNKPMTQAVVKIIQLLPFIIDSSAVCKACKDSRKCASCSFNVKNISLEEQEKIFSAIN